ncbi:hypothetical protein GQ607_015309 [Colletotrichum asianum]|uniref:Uncharacterized protein n=1 Tax=Colletotrichum asianum TaxID=702518 RepID=A0A8H3VXX4_9PEZI|nr:hypothetical protein GQ607_015309 [Colletotrichum asianum]
MPVPVPPVPGKGSRSSWVGRFEAAGGRGSLLPRPPSRPPSTSPSTISPQLPASAQQERGAAGTSPALLNSKVGSSTSPPHAPGHASYIGRTGKDWAERAGLAGAGGGAAARGRAEGPLGGFLSSIRWKQINNFHCKRKCNLNPPTCFLQFYHRSPLLLSLCLSSEADPSVNLCRYLYTCFLPLLLSSPLSSPLLSSALCRLQTNAWITTTRNVLPSHLELAVRQEAE